MKKIFLFLAFFLLQIGQIFANLEVKSNLESGKYNFPVELNLISNDKNAKIFYYTDGIGRMDTIMEFTKPILLKENTTVDFFATTKDFQDTPIQTANYSFEYSDKIILILEKNKITLKNTDKDVQNIGYWKIESDTLNYEISPNTFLEKNKTFSLDYKLENNQKITLYSPDKKEKKQEIFKVLPKKESSSASEKNEKENEIIPEISKENLSFSGEENIGTGEISPQETNIINNNSLTEINTLSGENNFQINEHITASLGEKQTNNRIFFFLFYVLSIIILSIISYNIYIVHSKSIQLKINSKFKKNKKI